MSNGEECKAQGNVCFNDKRFEEALTWYNRAIEHDPRNAVYLNNRAATYLELRRYAEAAADAERSAILAPTAKANARHARALNSLGQSEDAIKAYQRAQRLDPQSDQYQKAIEQIRAAGRGGSAPGSSQPQQPAPRAMEPWMQRRCLELDLTVVLSAVIFLPLIFLAPTLSLRVWQLALLSMVLRQLLNLYRVESAASLKSFGFWKTYVTSGRITREFSGQYLALAAVFLAFGTGPQQFIFFAMAIYCIVDLATDLHGTFVSLIPARFQATVIPKLNLVRQQPQQFWLQAAACEALSLFIVPFAGAGIAGTLLTVQFIKWRYQSDQWSKMAWGQLYQQGRSATLHPRCPQFVNSLYEKIAGLIRRGGQ